MPFAYYRKLSAADKRVYRRSDEITWVAIPDGCDMADRVEGLREALEEDGRCRPVQRAVRDLSGELLGAFAVGPVSTRVRAVRPQERDGSELHGLYTREEGRRPVIELWMRTARQKRVVRFRTFLRTLVHELLHHLDFELFDLDETFHTEGFFKRESGLYRQLIEQWEAAHLEQEVEDDVLEDDEAEEGDSPEERSDAAPAARGAGVRGQLRLF